MLENKCEHGFSVINRENIKIDGVKDVISFDESLLCHVGSVFRVVGHAQGKVIYIFLVSGHKLFKGVHITFYHPGDYGGFLFPCQVITPFGERGIQRRSFLISFTILRISSSVSMWTSCFL